MNLENRKTTLAGILAALGAALMLVPLPDDWKWVPPFLSALGAALIGAAAKDSTTHSTVAEVSKATEVVKVEAEKKVEEAIKEVEELKKEVKP